MDFKGLGLRGFGGLEVHGFCAKEIVQGFLLIVEQ